MVTTEPWWRYELAKKRGTADPNARPEEKIVTTIRFRAEHPDLKEIEAKSNHIAGMLPEETNVEHSPLSLSNS